MSGKANRICLGVITAPHGVRGAVRIKSFTAASRDIARYGALEDASGERRFLVSVVGEGKGVLLARLAGVENRDRAEALRGVRLYLPREKLPEPEEGEYYHADLLGLAAELPDGTRVGEVCAIHDFGAGDTLEIARADAAPVLVPFTRSVVPVVDVAGGRLVLDPPPGVLGAAEAESGRR